MAGADGVTGVSKFSLFFTRELLILLQPGASYLATSARVRGGKREAAAAVDDCDAV